MTTLPRALTPRPLSLQTYAGDDAPPTEDGPALERFALGETLGIGGLGEVVGAEDRDLQRRVAIKRVRSDRWSPSSEARLAREALVAGRLEHRNIVPVHDVARDADGELFFVMRHVDGEALSAVIARLRAGDPETHAAWGFERRVSLVLDVLRALEHAHARGVVHRDVKPDNILVAPGGEVLLIDWGVAWTEDLGEERGLVGTPRYMSPAQARGEHRPHNDVYAAALVLHELITLTSDLDGAADDEEVLRRVRARVAPLTLGQVHSAQPAIPSDLSWLMFHALDGRFNTATELIRQIEDRQEGHVPVHCPVTFGKHGLRVIDRALDRAPMLVTGAFIAAPSGWIVAIALVALRGW